VSGPGTHPAPARSPFAAWAPIVLGALVVLGVVLNLSSVPGLLSFLPNAIVGSVLVIRRPGNLIGWLLLLMAVCFSTVGRGLDVTAALIGTGWASWLPTLAWLGTMSAVGLFVGLALLSATFPTGTLPGGGIGRMTRAALVVIVGIGLLQAVDPEFLSKLPDGTAVVLHNPIGIAPDWPGWSFFDGPAYMVILGAILVCTVGLLIRFRRAVGTERQQYKWLLASFALMVVAITFGFTAIILVDPEGRWAWIPAVFAYPLPSIAVGIAIMRYRLYDIDRIVSRTIAYAGVTVVLFAVFTGVNLVLQSIFESLVGGGSVAVAVSTLAVAALFNPVRGRLQRVVDRRFNRARRDAELTVDRFAGRLRGQLDLDAIGTELTGAAVGAVEPAAATFWLRRRTLGTVTTLIPPGVIAGTPGSSRPRVP
jgi:hypothetical protein